MLTKILSISGKPGLYKLISTAKNLNIVESVQDGKKMPIYFSEKVVALSDVSIYTMEADVPLKDVFAFFEEVLPTYDTEKVYASDVKKIIGWYNLLIEHNIDFETVEHEEENSEEDQ